MKQHSLVPKLLSGFKLPAQLLDGLRQLADFLFLPLVHPLLLGELRVLAFELGFQFLIQSLDRGQRYAAFVNIGDMAIVVSHVEGSKKILRGRADVADAHALRFVIPGGNG